MIKKLKQQTGETLVEALVAMLIAVLSMTLLSTSVMTAANVNKANRAADEKFSQELQQAEGLQGTPKKMNVKLSFSNGDVKNVAVNVYGGDGSFISYDYEPEEN